MAAHESDPRRRRRPWVIPTVGLICSLSALAPLYPVGTAFLASTVSTSTSLRLPQTSRAQIRAARQPTCPYCSATGDEASENTFQEVERRRREGEDRVRRRGQAEDDDEIDVIHPSAAWLNQPTASLGDEDESRKPSRRTLAVDYGTRRVGLAISVGILPRAVVGITNRGNDLEVVRHVLLRARGEGIREIVVGLPLIRNGTETEMCEMVRGFASVLSDAGAASVSPTSVYLWDERFSSAQAGALLDRHGGGVSKKVEIDSLAASLILQHYFAEGGSEKAERVEPRIATAEILYAAGRDGSATKNGIDDDEEDGQDWFGLDSKRRKHAGQAEST